MRRGRFAGGVPGPPGAGLQDVGGHLDKINTHLAVIASLAPQELITAVAGLALMPALISSLSAAFGEQTQLEAPALTFLIAASGMTLFGVSGAFWGILAGSVVWMLKDAATRRQ